MPLGRDSDLLSCEAGGVIAGFPRASNETTDGSEMSLRTESFVQMEEVTTPLLLPFLENKPTSVVMASRAPPDEPQMRFPAVSSLLWPLASPVESSGVDNVCAGVGPNGKHRTSLSEVIVLCFSSFKLYL